jgi:hypothetical protein
MSKSHVGVTGPGYAKGCVFGIKLTYIPHNKHYYRSDGIRQASYAIQILFWELSLTVYLKK